MHAYVYHKHKHTTALFRLGSMRSMSDSYSLTHSSTSTRLFIRFSVNSFTLTLYCTCASIDHAHHYGIVRWPSCGWSTKVRCVTHCRCESHVRWSSLFKYCETIGDSRLELVLLTESNGCVTFEVAEAATKHVNEIVHKCKTNRTKIVTIYFCFT